MPTMLKYPYTLAININKAGYATNPDYSQGSITGGATTTFSREFYHKLSVPWIPLAKPALPLTINTCPSYLLFHVEDPDRDVVGSLFNPFNNQ